MQKIRKLPSDNNDDSVEYYSGVVMQLMTSVRKLLSNND